MTAARFTMFRFGLVLALSDYSDTNHYIEWWGIYMGSMPRNNKKNKSEKNPHIKLFPDSKYILWDQSNEADASITPRQVLTWTHFNFNSGLKSFYGVDLLSFNSLKCLSSNRYSSRLDDNSTRCFTDLLHWRWGDLHGSLSSGWCQVYCCSR